MLERCVCLSTGHIIRDVKLDTAAHVLDRGEARLAHDPFQYHASSHADSAWRLFQHFVGIITIFPMKILCKIVAAKIIGKSITRLTQRTQFGATLLDKLDLCVNPIMRFVQIFLQSVIRQFQLLFFLNSYAVFQTGVDEILQPTVKHGLGISGFDTGAQVLDA